MFKKVIFLAVLTGCNVYGNNPQNEATIASDPNYGNTGLKETIGSRVVDVGGCNNRGFCGTLIQNKEGQLGYFVCRYPVKLAAAWHCYDVREDQPGCRN